MDIDLNVAWWPRKMCTSENAVQKVRMSNFPKLNCAIWLNQLYSKQRTRVDKMKAAEPFGNTPRGPVDMYA